MKGFFVGTVLVIGGAFLFAILCYVGVSPMLARVVSISFSSIGFIIQIYSAFKMKFYFEREIARLSEEYSVLLRKATDLMK